MRYVAVLVLLASLITGCGSSSEAVKPTPLQPIEPAIDISRVWYRGFDFTLAEPPAVLTPATAGKQIYIAEPTGRIFALAAKTGKLLWRHRIDGTISSGLGLGEGLILGGTVDGEVFAVQADDGTLVWRRRVASEVLAAPSLGSGIVVARTVDDQLTGLDAADGREIWRFERKVPALTLRGTSSPVIADDKVLVGLANGGLVALGLFDGRLIWETQISEPEGRSELERMVDVDADPVVVGDVVYAVAYQGRLAAIELGSGRLLWTREFSSYKDLAVRGDILFVVDERGNLWALDRHSGASLWKQDKFIGRRITSPATLGDYVVVGDFEGYVHWLDNDTGRILGRYLADSQGITMPLIALGSRIYVIGNSGLMKAFKADAKDNR